MPTKLSPDSQIVNGWTVADLANLLGLDELALAEYLSSPPGTPRQAAALEAVTRFHQHWSMTTTDLARLVEENPSLRSFIMGYGAELQLRVQFFEGNPNFQNLRKEDDHDRERKGDLTATYRNRDFVFEVKSLQTNSLRWSSRRGELICEYQCDASDSRYITFSNGVQHQTTSLVRGEFDVIAVCLFPLTHSWDFLFALNEDLASSSRGKLKNPRDAQDGRSLTAEELAELIKGAQRMTFSEGWRVDPAAYFTTPESAVDEILRREAQGNRPSISEDEDKHREAAARERRREATRAQAEAARQSALDAFGPWKAPG